MLNTYSSRDIERLCKRDMFALAILSGSSAPDHTTINRFIQRNANPIDELFYDVVKKLEEKGELLKETIFQDGTKIESRAGKYTFVWKGAVTKNAEKCEKRLRQYLNKANELGLSLLLEEGNDFQSVYNELIVVKNKIKEMDLPFDAPLKKGRGNKQKRLVKHYKQICEDLKKVNDYDILLALIGDNRNSMSKTDPDATFMHLKEDHMRNAQLKPAYNLQLAVEGEYITGLDISSERSDQLTLIPLLEKMENKIGCSYGDVTADAGYESEENYTYFEKKGQVCYIKPQNYERSKTRKFKNNMALRENMRYDAEKDEYTCQNGKKLKAVYTGTRKSKSGFESEITYYECESCEGCPHKKSCTRAKGNRKISLSKKFIEQRKKSLDNITSPMGILLRTNRSIQSEGAFGVIKENYKFRQFLLRGKKKVSTEITLLAIAYNINKYHSKIMNNRTGSQLHGKLLA